MFSQDTQKQSKEDTLFEVVYQLAKEKNEAQLTEMVKKGYCINAFQGEQGEYNLVMLLAKERDSESVEFLINKFKASRHHAVQGYARGGHVEEVNFQIEQGASRDYAVQGYAFGGHVEDVNDQIEQGASRNFAVYGYAFGGHVEDVNDQIAQGASRDEAVQGYAFGGHVKDVNDQIEQGASRDYAVTGYAAGGHVEEVNGQIAHGASRNSAVQGYASGGHVNEGNILRLMAFTGDKELRESLAKVAKKKSDSLDVPALEIKADKLTRIMKEHQLNFQESQSLTVTGARAWLLQGPQLIRDQKINSDIFWEITMRVLGGLSLDETKRVFASAHNHLFSGMKGDFTTGIFSFFRPQQETEKPVHEVKQKHQKRIKF